MGAQPTTEDHLGAGREAIVNRAWPEAYDHLRAADSEGSLEPGDLERLAKAAYWTGRAAEAIEARERAYGAHIERGDRERAAFAALTLRREHATKLAGSIAQGWLGRAEKLLEGRPESVAHGYLAIAHGELARNRGEFEHALEHVDRALEIAGRSEDRDLLAWAVMRRGMVLVAMGRMDEGWSLMEEVSAAAVGGELGDYTTGAVFCNVVSICRDLADYARAREWSDAAKRWCERQAIAGFPGVCRVHRAEVMRLIGAWDEAETEVRRASAELADFSPAYAGMAHHELGEVRLRVGDLEGAEEAFHRAHELGEDPQPGLALLHLARGKVDAAATSIARSLEELAWDRLARARLLPAQAEISRAMGDAAGARDAASELDAIAEEFGTSAIRAGADWSHGLVALVEGDHAEAVRRLRRARQGWKRIDAPYEAARAGMALAEAHLGEGDREAAALELRTARAVLVRLGAQLDVRRADEMLAAAGAERPGERTLRTFMFTDVVGSTVLIEAIGDEAWENLRRWHDQALRRCFSDHDGQEVDHAGDGFFVAFPDVAAAIACAIDIQRRLADHRREHGFAPQVRIGLHSAEALDAGGDYSGVGVHRAARIGAAAGGGEIVASAESIRELSGVRVSQPRRVTLKGISDPVEVVSIDWR